MVTSPKARHTDPGRDPDIAGFPSIRNKSVHPSKILVEERYRKAETKQMKLTQRRKIGKFDRDRASQSILLGSERS